MVRYLQSERRINQLIEQGREAGDLFRDPVATVKQFQHTVQGFWVLFQQNQVSAAPANSQHQVENTVECVLVQGFLIDLLQQLRHETIQAAVCPVTQSNPFKTPHEIGQWVVFSCCRGFVNFLAVDSKTAPHFGPFVISGPFGPGGENALEAFTNPFAGPGQALFQ